MVDVCGLCVLHCPTCRVFPCHPRYNTQAAVSWWTWVLHIGIVIIGGYFIANLALAVIYLQFTRHYAELAGRASLQDEDSDDSEFQKGSPSQIIGW